MPRPPTPRPLGEYQAALSRLLRQMETDERIPIKLKATIADALTQVGDVMVGHVSIV